MTTNTQGVFFWIYWIDVKGVNNIDDNMICLITCHKIEYKNYIALNYVIIGRKQSRMTFIKMLFAINCHHAQESWNIPDILQKL